MRKICAVLAAAVLLAASAAAGDSLDDHDPGHAFVLMLSDEELLRLHREVTEEIAARGIAPEGSLNGQGADGYINSKRIFERAPGGLPRFGSFGEAADAAGENGVTGGDTERIAAVMEHDGKYIRVWTALDSRAKELFEIALVAEDAGEAMEAYDLYVRTLPVSMTEEITAKPVTQAELDALAGKTVGELIALGYAVSGSGGGEGMPTVFTMSDGFFDYDFEINVSFREYLERQENEDFGDLTVKGGRFAGLSALALDPELHADGSRGSRKTRDGTIKNTKNNK